MAFVLKQSASYSWPVSVKLPADGGKFEKQTFDAEFKRLPQARINEIQAEVQARIKAAENNELLEGGITDQSIAAEILVGWSGIVDDEGDEIAFTNANRDQLLDVPTVAAAVILSYFDSIAGNKAKN